MWLKKMKKTRSVRLRYGHWQTGSKTWLKKMTQSVRQWYGHWRVKCKLPGLFSSRVIILHDNARAHTARITFAFLDAFCWIIFTHLPAYYYLFPLLKIWLGMQRFTSNVDLETKVNAWFQQQDPSFYARSIDLLVSCYDKCMHECSLWLRKKIKNFLAKILVFDFCRQCYQDGRKKIVAMTFDTSSINFCK